MFSRDPSSRFTIRCLLILLQLSVSLPLPAVDRPLPDITICYNYNCNRTAHVRPAIGEWQAVLDQFKPAARSAVEEREMIRRAIAVLEHIAGKQTPTFRDRGRNPIVDDWPGQMDCIDESTNTKRYLDLLQARGLLRWHRVADRVSRAPHLFDQHWAGQIIEVETLDHYVVDSWFLDNGNLPYIQALNNWLRKDPIQ
ncbi:MAG: hypothetical protein ABFS24_07870 [Pseudomonadota bacterium]